MYWNIIVYYSKNKRIIVKFITVVYIHYNTYNKSLEKIKKRRIWFGTL